MTTEYHDDSISSTLHDLRRSLEPTRLFEDDYHAAIMLATDLAVLLGLLRLIEGGPE